MRKDEYEAIIKKRNLEMEILNEKLNQDENYNKKVSDLQLQNEDLSKKITFCKI